MERPEREKEPVIYNAAAVKLLHFSIEKSGTECFRMHWHERMELLRIRSGSILMDYGAHQEEIGPGQVVIIHPNQLHRGICVQTPLVYDVLMFDVRTFYNGAEGSQQYLTSLQVGTTRFASSTDCPAVLTCVDAIVEAGTEGVQVLAVIARLYALMYLLHVHCLLESKAASAPDEMAKQVTEYIERHYAEPLSTERLCSRFGYSKSYFCRKFRRSTGLTPIQYINLHRVETAYREIIHTGKDIMEIATECGFQDPNYFSRMFKKHFRHSPSYYRSPAFLGRSSRR